MVVVSRTLLKQDEQGKLFLRNLKCFLKRIHEIKETIHLPLGRNTWPRLYFIGGHGFRVNTKQVLQFPCVQKPHSQITCLRRDCIWLNVWCLNYTAKFRNDCNRLNTMSQENRHYFGEWGVNNCWIFKYKPQEHPWVYNEMLKALLSFLYFLNIVPFKTSITSLLRHNMMQSWGTLQDRVFGGLQTWIVCILHIIHTNSLPRGSLYKRVHPA